MFSSAISNKRGRMESAIGLCVLFCLFVFVCFLFVFVFVFVVVVVVVFLSVNITMQFVLILNGFCYFHNTESCFVKTLYHHLVLSDVCFCA